MYGTRGIFISVRFSFFCCAVTRGLEQVPKMLGHVRQLWCPHAFAVGFKLETDPDILAFKAVGSLRKYGLHVVVANEMDKRKDRVMLVSLGGIGHGGGAGAGAGAGSQPQHSPRVEEAGQVGISNDNGLAQKDWIQRPG